MKYSFLFYISLLLIGSSLLIVFTSNNKFGKQSKVNKIERIFQKKYDKTIEILKAVEGNNFKGDLNVTSKALQENISILIFNREILEFWSDSHILLVEVEQDTTSKGIVCLANSIYYKISQLRSGKLFVGYIKLENTYPYENKFLQNGLLEEFKVNSASVIVNSSSDKGLPVFLNNGEHAFSIIFNPEPSGMMNFWSKASSLLFFAGFILLLLFFRQYLVVSTSQNISIKFIISFTCIILIKLFILTSDKVRDHFYLFDPYIYATKIAPTLGDLIINSFLFLFIAYILYEFIKIPQKFLDNNYNRNAWIGILSFLYVFVLYLAHKSSVGIIDNSSLNLVMHNISQVSSPIIIAYFLIGINYLSVFIVGLWLFNTLSCKDIYRPVLFSSVFLLLIYVLSFPLKFKFDYYTVIFGVLFLILIGLLQKRIYGQAILTSLVTFLCLFALYVMIFTIKYSNVKSKQRNESFAVSLSNEHDPIAEYLFDEITSEIHVDEALISLLDIENFNQQKFHSYLTDHFFSGYMKKYNVGLTVCRPTDSVLIEIPDITWYPCYDYFKYYINQLGIQIPGTDFYYIDDYTGLISYFGWIKLKNSFLDEVSVFLELNSKLTTDPLGYPELLLDDRFQGRVLNDRISYAKYHLGNLVSKYGKYEYSLISDVFEQSKEKGMFYDRLNNYKHLVYRPEEDSLIIVSEKALTAIDIIVLFSYLFVFYYILALFVLFIMVSRFRNLSFKDSLRNRIQFSVVLMLIVSLIVIAGSTTWFNIKKYNQSQVRILTEKIQSVYVELEHKLSYEEKLTREWSSNKYDNLEQLLIKFSEVFYSDINLYSPEGDLVASSRSEVFDFGLQNNKIAPKAYVKLKEEKLARYIHRERINKLSYLSAYVPFVNVDGELLAYLNLPYFTKQKELQDDITTLTVAIINVYVLLILITILVVVFISNQITKPLEMLQSKFKVLKLGSKYEQINYNRKDEIGRLVQEYNRMVLELEKSVALLAKSERESAWREMAKQIAHEIKNPLTPMRLSLQQLQRAWDDKKENFESYLSRVTNTIIEQIDNLSTIASEFSNFAKMPVAKIEKVDLGEILLKSILLFKDNHKVNIVFNKTIDRVFVRADSEQLGRVFINIIKNGIQAIPDNQNGEIDIHLSEEKDMAVINISDNGKGIPQDIRNKLFMPNFTTKSSGMGLGLAIVQNTLAQMGGGIKFSTKIGEGTTFTISIPQI